MTAWSPDCSPPCGMDCRCACHQPRPNMSVVVDWDDGEEDEEAER
jgi:hypothetical protein